MQIPQQTIRDAIINMVSVQGDTEFASVEQQNHLLGNLHPTIPLWFAFEIAKFDLVTSSVPVELDVEAVVTEPRRIEAYSGLPLVEVVNPSLKVLSVVSDHFSIRHNLPTPFSLLK
jgi:hypothetical protein